MENYSVIMNADGSAFITDENQVLLCDLQTGEFIQLPADQYVTDNAGSDVTETQTAVASITDDVPCEDINVCTLPPVCKCACPGTDVNYSLHETQMPAPDQLSAHGTAADVPSELDTSDMTEEHDTVSHLSNCRWTHNVTKTFIEVIRSKYHRIGSSTSLKNKVWLSVSNDMKQRQLNVSAEQCRNKWRQLKKRYKDVYLKKTKSGNGRIDWEFYEDIHDFMFNKPEVRPVATCSSTVEHSSSAPSKHLSPVASSSSVPAKPLAPVNQLAAVTDSQISAQGDTVTVKKPKRMCASGKDRRHQENIERKDKFLQLFEKMIDKF